MALQKEVRNAIILSSHNGYRPFVGSVGIENGRIAVVREKTLGMSSDSVVDARGCILMPGLVNGHCHGDMTVTRGLGDGLTLQEQNEIFGKVNWFKNSLSEKVRYDSRQLTYCEALLSGTTFILENMYWGMGAKSAACMKETGIFGGLAEDVRKDFENPLEFLPEEERTAFVSSCKENGLLPVFGAVSEEDFSPEIWKKIRGIAKQHGVSITAHIAETLWRQEIIQEKYGVTPVQFLEKNDALHKNFIASHMVHPNETEIISLAKSGTKVVNTPLCEMKIADGIAPIPAMVKSGVTVGLGTDGAMWNNSNDIFREMKAMALLHTVTSGIRTFTAEQILDMATINGARVFGLEKEMGTIEAGKRADFILVDTNAPHMVPIRLGPCENVASQIVYSATGADVRDVFVQGEHVVKNKRMPWYDLPALCKRVTEYSENVVEDLLWEWKGEARCSH